MHHVALRVELAEDRVQQPVRLHPEPQLELVGGDVDEVDREVVARAGVHAGRALPGVDAAEVLLDQQLALPCEQRVELGEQLLVAGRPFSGVLRIVDRAQPVPFDQQRLLDADLLLERVELGDDLQVLLDVGRADRVRPLEHHVLEEMRNAGDAGPLVHRADPGDPSGGHVRIPRPGHEQERHPVVELVLDDAHLLSRGGGRQEQKHAQGYTLD